MARFVVLMDWTEQGIKSAKESPQRVAQARAAWKAKGVEIEVSETLVSETQRRCGSPAPGALRRPGAAGPSPG